MSSWQETGTFPISNKETIPSIDISIEVSGINNNTEEVREWKR
jgi:hypothetical protein